MHDSVFLNEHGKDRKKIKSQVRTITLASETEKQTRVTYYPDGYVEIEPQRWFNLQNPIDNYPELLSYRNSDGYLIGTVGGLLIEQPSNRILVDTGFGPDYVPRNHTHSSMGLMLGGAMSDFSDSIGSIDAVVLTHFHPDHIGWLIHNMKFPTPILRETPVYAGVAQRCKMADLDILPVSELIDHTTGLTALSTPGHSPEHISLIVQGEQERLVIIGDVMHSAAQVRYPELYSCFESDASLSYTSRLRILDELEQQKTIGFGGHFADVVFGKVINNMWAPI